MWTLLDFIQEELATFTGAQYEAMLSLSASREIQSDLQIEIKTLENYSLSFKTDKRQFLKQFWIFIFFSYFLSFFFRFKRSLEISKRAFKKILSIIINFILNLSDI